MIRPVEIALLGTGGVALFSLCFVGFTALSGVPLSQVPLVSKVVPADGPPTGVIDAADLPAGEISPGPNVERAPVAPEQVVQANLGVLGAFAVAAPFDRRELERLSDELKARDGDLGRREHELDLRERAVEDQLALLQERFDSLAALRAQLDQQAAELERRAAEVERDEEFAAQSGELRYAALARLFAEGEVEDAVTRLLRFDAAEAARILAKLEPTRADELLKAVPDAQFLDYAEAYAALGPGR